MKQQVSACLSKYCAQALAWHRLHRHLQPHISTTLIIFEKSSSLSKVSLLILKIFTLK
jgi:hypothetical protein